MAISKLNVNNERKIGITILYNNSIMSIQYYFNDLHPRMTNFCCILNEQETSIISLHVLYIFWFACCIQMKAKLSRF